jgi:hypothetical protein
LETLLPLNVPRGSPLMYCPDKNLQQFQIKLDNRVYRCSNNTLLVECDVKNENVRNSMSPTDYSQCFDNEIPCNIRYVYINKYFASTSRIFCDSVSLSDQTLQCHFGYLPPSHASFIPTTLHPDLDEYYGEPETSFIQDIVSFFVDWFTCKKEPVKKVREPYNATDTEEWLPKASKIMF